MLARYAEQLAAVGGRLYLSGVDEHVRKQFRRSGKLGVSDAPSIYAATSVVGESSRHAYADAKAVLVSAKTGQESSD